MDRLEAAMSLVLVIAVVAVGIVVWRADAYSRDAMRELSCIQRTQATATVAMLAPRQRIDDEGRLAAMEELSSQLDNC